MPSNAGRPAQLAQRAVNFFLAVQKPKELEGLIRIAEHVLRPGQGIVEIGSDAGGTLFVWRKLAGFVVSVDLLNGPYSSGRHLMDYGAYVIRGDSHQPEVRAELVRVLAGRQVGMLFIDGDHSYRGARQDFEEYGSLVAPGGIIALHDICDHHPVSYEIDVHRLWLELRDKYRSEAIIAEPKTWGGIGVLHVA